MLSTCESLKMRIRRTLNLSCPFTGSAGTIMELSLSSFYARMHLDEFHLMVFLSIEYIRKLVVFDGGMKTLGIPFRTLIYR